MHFVQEMSGAKMFNGNEVGCCDLLFFEADHEFDRAAAVVGGVVVGGGSGTIGIGGLDSVANLSWFGCCCCWCCKRAGSTGLDL